MLCGLKKANNSLLLYYYILLQVLQQGHSRISNELRITALRLVNQVFFQEYESRSKVHIVWKLLKMSHLDFLILVFSTNFCPIKTDLSGNNVWLQASGFQKLAKMDQFWHF